MKARCNYCGELVRLDQLRAYHGSIGSDEIGRCPYCNDLLKEHHIVPDVKQNVFGYEEDIEPNIINKDRLD